MTVSSSSTYEFDIAKLVRLSYATAGLMGAGIAMSGADWTNKLALAMDGLEVELKSLQAAGIFVRPVDFYDLAVIAGTAQYAMPPETLDLVGNAMWLADDSTFQLAVIPIQRAQYFSYANKDSQGQPTSYYADREAVMNVFLYPTPADSGTLRFQRHRLLANALTASATVDLERHWMKYLMYELGKWLAYVNNLDKKAAALDGQADRAKTIAMSYSKQRGPQQLEIGHRTGWTR